MAYCVYGDINLMSNITSSDVANEDITNLIAEATKQINSDINVEVIREPISPIDNTRENKINSSNKTYYVRNWNGKFLADHNSDGEITKDDVIVYQVTSDGTETTPTITSVDDDDCSITLESAPSSGVRLYVTYSYSTVRQLVDNVDEKLKLACVFLATAYCYAKINIGRAPNVQFGTTRIARHMDSYNHYYERYLDLIRQINSTEEVHSKVSDTTI